LAALGITSVRVSVKPLFGILSTGDELVDFTEKPEKGKIRNVNSVLLEAAVRQSGGLTKSYGIIRDDEEALFNAVQAAASECQAVLISGGSSVGIRDVTARVIEKQGRLLFHGIAMKPGKPTILGSIGDKPVFGLPGHPVAAYFAAQLFIVPLAGLMMGRREKKFSIMAKLSEAISSNHGRAEYIGVILDNGGEMPTAHPIHGKSGLITSLSGSDGYICISRDCEGLPKGADISVILWNR
jgi:molybdopterin molybdotransferase